MPLSTSDIAGSGIRPQKPQLRNTHQLAEITSAILTHLGLDVEFFLHCATLLNRIILNRRG